METNLDQKQLLVLGYLRQLLNVLGLKEYQFDSEEKKNENEIDSPMLTHQLTPMSRFDEQMQLFNLGIPQFQARRDSIDSLASDLSDHEMLSYGDFTLPLTVIQFIYLYFNRYQNYLLLMSGSEECKNNSYNQIQIINLRNVSDIKQKIEYAYTNYRLRPVLWRERINYQKYFTKSLGKYLSQSKTVTTPTPQPLSVIDDQKQQFPETPQPIKIGLGTKESKTKDINTITIQSPGAQSPWSSKNSPYSPFAQIESLAEKSKLTPSLPAMGALKLKPRSKSSSNLSKLGKKDAMKMKGKKGKSKAKTVSMKKRKSAANILAIRPKKGKKGTLTPKKNNKKPMRRHSTNALLGKKGKKRGKKQKNIVTDNNEFDRYSYGECIMSISNGIIGSVPNWPWFKAKYKSEIKRVKDHLEFAKYKMFIRCGGIYTKDDEYTNQNDLILFNAANLNDIGRQIDSYYCKLPPFKQKIESPAIVYNHNSNLLSFGGYSYDEGKALKWIYSLNLNVRRKKFKWKKYGCPMNKPRYDSAITHIIDSGGQNKFIIIGGKGSSTKPIDSCEMFDSSKTTKESKCVILRELNFARFKPGSCQINGKSKIACAGGILYGRGANRVEIYDVYKDKWSVHVTPLQYDHQHPTIWSEVKQINPNILYVAGNNISFGAKKGSLGFIEWTDLRVKDKKFKLLYDEPIEELYEFWGVRPNIWEPRSLLQFAL